MNYKLLKQLTRYYQKIQNIKTEDIDSIMSYKKYTSYYILRKKRPTKNLEKLNEILSVIKTDKEVCDKKKTVALIYALELNCSDLWKQMGYSSHQVMLNSFNTGNRTSPKKALQWITKKPYAQELLENI